MIARATRRVSRRCARRAALLALLAATAFAVAACPRPQRQEALRPGGPQTAKTAFQRKQGRPPVAAAPQQLLGRDGVRQLQRALRARGFATVPLDGSLESETRAALLEFQRRERLAPTSLPDLGTLQRLGIDGDRLYQAL